jgi:hypothetical protein
LEPAKLAGSFGTAATMRGDLVSGIDGTEFAISFNVTEVGTFTKSRPTDYFESVPQSKAGDFMENAVRLK